MAGKRVFGRELLRALVLCLAAFFWLAAFGGPEDERFVGTWKLLSLELRSEDGGISYPLGNDAKGIIIYSADGYMSVILSGADRARFAVDDSLGGTEKEKADAYSTYFSYCGPYEVRGNVVIHHIELSSFPNWSGTDKERFFKFDDNKLILSASPYLVGGKEQTPYVIWERVR